MARVLYGIGALFLVGIFTVLLWWFLATPSHNREWREDYAKLPNVTWASDSMATVENVRDWVFTSPTYPEDKTYISKKIRIEDLEQAYFMVEPFSEWSFVGHTFFLFKFKDGSTVVASIEARREKGEEYSIIKGLLPYFEYMYVWTTERDMFTNTTFFANDNLYQYPLTISLESQKHLLKRLLERTEKLSEEPRFYNLLTANCTNLLAREANAIRPGSVPFHYSWILAGYADTYLHSLGFIPNDELFEVIEAKALITPFIQDAVLRGVIDEQAFSGHIQERTVLRGGIPKSD